MTRIHRSATAAAVLVTAAAVLLGGCGSGSGHDDKAQDRPTVSVGTTGTGTGTDGPAQAGDPAATTEAPGSAADAPKVPDSRLTPPGGGTFTKSQKSYLSGRVPTGTDPVAVLEGGQEICDRLTRTVRIDKDAAAAAVITGDISLSGASAAVTSLCPAQQPVLDAAVRGFADGSFTVAAKAVPGKVVAPGTYRAPNTSPTCNWRVSGANGKTLSSGSGARLTVPAAARGVTSSGCYAWLASGGTR